MAEKRTHGPGTGDGITLHPDTVRQHQKDAERERERVREGIRETEKRDRQEAEHREKVEKDMHFFGKLTKWELDTLSKDEKYICDLLGVSYFDYVMINKEQGK